MSPWDFFKACRNSQHNVAKYLGYHKPNTFLKIMFYSLYLLELVSLNPDDAIAICG